MKARSSVPAWLMSLQSDRSVHRRLLLSTHISLSGTRVLAWRLTDIFKSIKKFLSKRTKLWFMFHMFMTVISKFRCIFVASFCLQYESLTSLFQPGECLSAYEMTRGKSSQRPCSKSVFCKARPQSDIKSVSKERSLDLRSIGHEASQMMMAAGPMSSQNHQSCQAVLFLIGSMVSC